MMNLREVETLSLVRELESRRGIRSTKVHEDEFSKIEVKGKGDKHLRYIKGYGPLKILEVKL